MLEEIAGRSVPSPSNTKWNFKSKTVNAVKEMKTAIIECCEKLQLSSSNKTSPLATAIKHNLESENCYDDVRNGNPVCVLSSVTTRTIACLIAILDSFVF